MLDLSPFYGTETHTRHRLLNKSLLMTDGVKYVADTAGAYWLMDLILSVRDKWSYEEFVVINLKLRGTAATVTLDDGNGNIIYSQDIPYTDFPQDIKFYLADEILMLPSEY